MLKFVLILAAVAVCYGTPPSRTKYYLYTKRNENRLEGMAGTGTFPAAADTSFDATENTIILIHGHGGHHDDNFNSLIRKEILLNRPNPSYNIIEVDWRTDAEQTYSTASLRVPLIGAEVAEFIKWLCTSDADFNQIHLVGFGLGAHVAGIAGRRLMDETRIPVSRITGLDPAGSGWGSNSQRLRNTDANYVEVIHTDGSGLLANGIGTAIGDVDFYVNGGNNQPGCLSHSCSHNRAFEVFAASISNNNLVGRACNSFTQVNLNLCRGDKLKLGDTHLSKPRSGRYFRINTKRSWPF
uniref:Pancreatic lipase 3 n=1 Tax=Mamestra configurata TaxID=174822 RepID=B2ZGH8_9NEOP|nr:pancreatic lipase 3 [Mamestra configurata]